jgi:DNA-binding GntR family transcriptional regulator
MNAILCEDVRTHWTAVLGSALMTVSETDVEPLQLTLQAAAHIRGLIIDRVLLPGEKIRQVDLAERIGVSRSPLREALRTLESEGVVSYSVNRGYVVARLDDDDLAQIYRMRSVFERELLVTIARPPNVTLTQLSAINTDMISAIDREDFADVLRLNREFHFTIFDLSPLNQFRREAQRLWQLSEGHSTQWWWRTPEARTRIDAEHSEIIRLLGLFDLDRLVEVCESHRIAGHERAFEVSGNRTARREAARSANRVRW